MDILTGIAVIAFIAAVFLFFIHYYYRHIRKNPLEWDGEDTPEPEQKRPLYHYTPQDGKRGEPRTCPVCAAKFELGENVISKIFPPTGKTDRLLHIQGCKFCLSGGRERKCPVCGADVDTKEYLIARIFERPGKSHVHVQGCPHCIGH